MKSSRAVRSSTMLAISRSIEALESRRLLNGDFFNLASGSLSQNWDNAALITTNDDWSAVPSIEGYNGAGLTSGTNVDPQTLLAPTTGALNVFANKTSTNSTDPGFSEFLTSTPVGTGGVTTGSNTVAFQGAGSAKAPFLKINLNATGRSDVHVKYDLIDIDAGAGSAAQQVALQYRVGGTGNYINVATAYVPDASDPATGAIGKVTSRDVVLPAAVNGAAQIEVRIMTTDATGNDQFIAIDNIVVSSSASTSTPGSLAFTAATLTTTEDVGTYNLTVSRTGGASGAATVDYVIAAGTATTPADFGGTLSGTVSFADNETSKTIPITIVQDSIVEGAENFTVTLSNATGATLGSPASTTVTINDDDVAVPGSFSFASANFSVAENVGLATITVKRNGGTSGAVSVNYGTDVGTALSPSDFIATSGTLNFADGQDTATFTVPITDDTVTETSEFFYVTLNGATGGATIDTLTATVTITDDDVVIPTGLLLNEAFVDPPTGANTPKQFIEIRGTPGTSLDNVYILQIDGDANENAGTLDMAIDLSGFHLGTNGLALVTAATGGWTPQDAATQVITTTQLDATGTGFEFGAYSFVLVFRNSAGASVPATGTDFDSDNAKDANGLGTLDALPTNLTVLDGFGTIDSNNASDVRYIASLPALTTGGSADAVVRLNNTPSDPNAFYYGILSTSPNVNTNLNFSTTAGARSSNFPAGIGIVTPGAANAVASTPPTVVSAVFDPKVGQKVVVTFDKDVGASIAATDFTLTRNGGGAETLSLVVDSVSADGKTVTLSFANSGGVTSKVLPDGTYTFTARAGQIADTTGATLAADATSTVKFLNGDFDVSGQVEFNDLVSLAQNYGMTSGATFAKGDANYDGKVDFDDLVVLAQRYGNLASLSAQLGVGPVSPAPAAPARPARRPTDGVGDTIADGGAGVVTLAPPIAPGTLGTKRIIR